MSHDAHNTPPPPAKPPSLPPAGTGGFEGQLDDYLDGLLQGDELAAFERALASNPILKAQVNAQRSINDSLSRLFRHEEPIPLRGAPGATGGAAEAPTIQAPTLRLAGGTVGSGVESSGTPAKVVKRQSFRTSALVGLAAVLALTFAGLYVSGWIDISDFLGTSKGLISPQDVYERKVATGYNPDWFCETDEQFLELTNNLWGESLLVQNTEDVKVVGWSYYEPVLSEANAILLTKVDGKEVIVVMDRKANDRPLKTAKSSGLHVFNRVVGGVTMHEVTPFDTPRVLPLVQQR
jgi:hypothetical protein